MAETYNCNWDGYDASRHNISRHRTEACYASIFHTPSMRVLKVYFQVSQKYNLDDMNWFEENLIKHIMIPRVKAAYKEIPFPEPKPGDGHIGFKQWYNWKAIRVDLTKISAPDLYVLLSLYRYPQENPRCCVATREFVEEQGLDIITAFTNAHTNGPRGTGHTFLDPYRFVEKADQGIVDMKHWDLKQVWEELPTRYEKARYLFPEKSHHGGCVSENFVVPAPEKAKAPRKNRLEMENVFA